MRQQAGALVDCLWPGFSATDKQAGVAPVLSSPFDTKAGRVVVGLLAEGWTPAGIAAADPAELRQVFATRGCRLSGPLAGRLIARAASALAPHPAATAGKPATLAGLLGALAALDGQIAGLEAEMAPLLAVTQGAKLTQIRGVATVAAAGFVAFVGHTGRWSGVVQSVAGGRAGPGPQPIRRHRRKAMASAGRGRPGGGGRSWTWPLASAVNRAVSTTATRLACATASTPRWR